MSTDTILGQTDIPGREYTARKIVNSLTIIQEQFQCEDSCHGY